MRGRSTTLIFRGAAAALALSATFLIGCGDNNERSDAATKAPQLASAQLIAGDPYAISCGHVRNQQKWADATRQATVALSDREHIRGLNRLQATQSLFFAMTELCKGRPATYEPAEAAVRAVRDGTYRADLGTP
jgi:hypothetical protein